MEHNIAKTKMRKNKIRLNDFGKRYEVSQIEQDLFDNSDDRKKYFEQKRLLNQRRDFAKSKENCHDKMVEAIAKNPGLIGIIDKEYSSEVEVPLYNGKISKGPTDAIIMGEEIDFYIQYKSSNCFYNRKDAKKQFKTIESIKGKENKRFLYVYGNFQVIEFMDGKFKKFNYTPVE